MLQDHDLGLELLGHAWRLLHRSADIATADILLAHAAHIPSDVVAGEGLRNLLVVHLNGLDLAGHIGGLEDDLVVLSHDPGLHATNGHSAHAGDGVNILDRYAKGQVGGLLGHLEVVQSLQQGGALVPTQVLAGLGQIVAHQAGHGDEGNLLQLVSHHLEQLAHLILDLVEPLLVEGRGSGIDLVHGHNELVDAQGSGKEDVLLGLSHDPVRNGHDQNGGISLAGAGDHVLDEVSVSGAVHYSEVEFGGVEAVMGDVDGDTPLALLLEAVHNPGELEGCLSLSCCFFLVLINDVRIYCPRLEHQSAYGSRLAVVDMSYEC